MEKISSFITRQFAWLFIIALIIGMLFQPLSALIKPTIFYVLMSVLFFSYLKVDFSVMKDELRNVKQILILLVYVLIILPVMFFAIAWVLISVFNLSYSWAVAVLLLFAGPTGVMAPTAALLMGARFERALSNVIFTSFLAPLTIPLLLYLFARENNDVDLLQITSKLAMLVIVPCILAYILKKCHRKSADYIADNSALLSVLFLCTVIIGAVHGLTPKLKAEPQLLLIALSLAVLFFFLAFVCPWLFFMKQSKKDRLTVSIVSTWMNNGVIIVIVSQCFNDLTILLFVTLSEIPWGFAFLPASWFAKKILGKSELAV